MGASAEGSSSFTSVGGPTTGPGATTGGTSDTSGGESTGDETAGDGGTSSGSTTGTTGAGATCGNDVKEPGEICDGSDLDGTTCEDLGLPGGTLGCAPDCTAFDTASCEAPPSCGNGVQDMGEACDGTDLGGQTCQTQGFPGGTLTCLANCSGFDTSGCDPNPFCGDGVKNGSEACDGMDLGGETCQTQGFPGGTLVCLGNCAGFDTSGCDPNPFCGDGVKNGSEACDGMDLGGETCQSQGFAGGGTLACLGNCAGFDTSGCDAGPVCGDGVKNGSEACDGMDLGGQTCQSQGFSGGTLACKADCSGFDTSGCDAGPVCGNGVIEIGEVCDGNNVGGKTCSDFPGYEGNGLTCNADCSDYDLSGCNTCIESGGFCWFDADCCSGWCDWDFNECW